MRRFLVSAFVMSFLAFPAAAKKAKVVPPPQGWAQEGTKDLLWKGQCYYPPTFDKLEETERRTARQTALEAMKSQWNGSRNDGVSFDGVVIDDVETTLLGRPDRIEEIARKNLEFCKSVMGAGASTDAWGDWLRNLPSQLTAGECNNPVDYQLIQYLEVAKGWQQPIHFCRGNRVNIEATKSDMYRITEAGPWINAEGDTSQKALGSQFPCNTDNCTPGMLIGRFVTDAGEEKVFPIGIGASFEAFDNGTLTWQVNDSTFYDNIWRSQGPITDHTTITVTPAE